MPKTKKTKKIEEKAQIIERFNWRNYEYLSRFITERAKILPRKRTGLSAKNQRKLARSIKHARHLGLLPYKAEI